jgi:hypothetical protein
MKRALGMLAAATATAILVTGAIVVLVLRADFLTVGAQAIARVAFEHAALAVGAAASPLVATLLVGYAYMMRGMRRRAAAKAAAAGAAARAAPCARAG